MKTNFKKLDTKGTTVTNRGNQSIGYIENNWPQKLKGTGTPIPIGSLVDLSNIQDDYSFEEFFENSKEQASMRDPSLFKARIQKENLSEKIKEKITSKPFTISDKRLKMGFSAGLVDFVKDALIKTHEGWINQSGLIKFNDDATLDDMIKYSKSIGTEIIPSIDVNDIYKFYEEGEIKIGSKEPIAYLNKNDKWVNKRNHEFEKEDIIRVIFHEDDPYYLHLCQQDDMYLKGEVSRGPEPSENKSPVEGTSKTGDAIYATNSVSESIMYANPFSFEVGGKLLSMKESGLIDKRNDFINGHLFKVTCNKASLISFDPEEAYLNTDMMPSHASFMAIAHANEINTNYVSNAWLDMIDSENTYSVYAGICKINNLVVASSPENNSTIKKLVQSLGYDGMIVQYPINELGLITNARDKLANYHDVLFESLMLKKEPILNEIDRLISNQKESISANAKDKHLVVFNQEMVEFSHLKSLPLNFDQYDANKNESSIYNTGRETKLEEVLNLPTPSSEEADLLREKSFESRKANISFSPGM